jgi:hypothetical protein
LSRPPVSSRAGSESVREVKSMAAKWVILFLLIMNVALLFMNSTLTVNVRALAGRERTKEVEAFRLERAQLMGERTRLEAKVGLLAETVKRLDAAIEKGSSRAQALAAPAREPSNHEGEAQKARFLSVLDGEFPDGKPDTSTIQFLSKEEWIPSWRIPHAAPRSMTRS